jgi:F-type H+-transporting ATPase subunit gamma
MANLQAIQKRITSVKNTQQLTRAMKMVAAARLRRVQDKVEQSRPFAAEVLKMIKEVLAKTMNPESLSSFLSNASEDNRTQKRKIRVLVIGSDRGLCGGYNTNVQKQITKTLRRLTEAGHEVSLDAIGKHAYEYAHKNHPKIPSHHLKDFHARFSRNEAVKSIDVYRQQFLKNEFDEFMCIYTEFRSAISQQVKCMTLFPITPAMILDSVPEKDSQEAVSKSSSDVLFEPSLLTLTQLLVISFLDSKFYQIILDAIASEHGSRMTAMENATKNAKEMIEKLTLFYNKQRQAKITNELLDIVGGVEAMNQK